MDWQKEQIQKLIAMATDTELGVIFHFLRGYIGHKRTEEKEYEGAANF